MYVVAELKHIISSKGEYQQLKRFWSLLKTLNKDR